MMDVPALLPDADMAALAAEVAEAVVVEAGAGVARDERLVARAVGDALERVAIHLDLVEPYADRASLPARVYDACIGLGCCYLKRPGAAYGMAGYEDPDPLGRRAEGAILASLTPGEKVGWGVA